jgi:hypothetical protein
MKQDESDGDSEIIMAIGFGGKSSKVLKEKRR